MPVRGVMLFVAAIPVCASPSGAQNGRTYGSGSRNPYGRYSSSDTDEDVSYTASFKPNAGKGDATLEDRKPDDGDSEA